MNNLHSWVHPGFTVFADPPVEAGNLESLESQARYIARPAMAMNALILAAGDRIVAAKI